MADPEGSDCLKSCENGKPALFQSETLPEDLVCALSRLFVHITLDKRLIFRGAVSSRCLLCSHLEMDVLGVQVLMSEEH